MSTNLKSGWKVACLLAVCATIASCKEDYIPAPITDGWRHERAKDSLYTVQNDDTIYSIAWAFDLDYRQLAQINQLAPPYRLSAGQKLKIYHGQLEVQTHAIKEVDPFIEEKNTLATEADHSQPSETSSFENSEEMAISPQRSKRPAVAAEPGADATPVNSSIKRDAATLAAHPATGSKQPSRTPAHFATPTKASSISAKGWQWPAQGKLIQGYSQENGALKGIDIAGSEGSSVLATRAGKVVYSGNGLRGYGKLLIIKHNDEFLSAYAHNQALLVREGQVVRQGQEIATMGKTGAGSVKLHFEIRRAGKPIDPLRYLKV